MKIPRFIQVFRYCSGSKCSENCVCLALEIEASKDTHRPVVRFLVTEGVRTREIHHCMFAVYDEQCMSLTSVYEWQKRFCKRRTSLQRDLCPGQVIKALGLT
ncbi:hypothetical protein ABEB36_014351 [Hypothenemus hampei]|uniref:Uncharacterized protein n=1 Tax=Hypothenemus hampei TaxID=57062 RepID=A0ABD1E8Q1_HYPHA